jgi:hypothetical protein
MIIYNGNKPRELYMNGYKCVKAYLGEKEVWYRNNKVVFLDCNGEVCNVQYVDKAEDIVYPPVPPITSSFYEGSVGWPNIINIDSDINVSPVISYSKGYIFKSGSGINKDISSGFNNTMTIYDGDLASNYGTVSKLSIGTSNISVSVIGNTNDANTNYRVAGYARSGAINVAALRNKGYTTLKFNGAYDLPAAYIYNTTNLRAAFFGITTGTTITAKTTGVSASNGIFVQTYASKSVGSTVTSVNAVSNSNWLGSISLPTSGNYYIIMGVLTKYCRINSNATGTTGSITINNIWLE